MESITHTVGRSASMVARIFSTEISASTLTWLPSSPRRRERKATCAPDSSPVTYSVGTVRLSWCSACNSSVLLPMPGSPPISTTPPSTMPPPSTRSNSSRPVGRRSKSAASMSASVVTGCAAASEAKRFLAAGAAVSATASISVFHAPQLGHLPSHLGLVPPHSVQL
jgi:hypothetical protein